MRMGLLISFLLWGVLAFIFFTMVGCTVFVGTPTIEQFNQHGQYRSVSSLDGDALQEMAGGADVDTNAKLK